MPRFRPRKTFRLVTHLQDGHSESLPAWKREERGFSADLQGRWRALHQHCADQSSHLRLARLFRRITHYDYGVRESALAELELATQLIRVGARVTFLPESQARTADLECRLARERFFVEITAMVGSADRRRLWSVAFHPRFAENGHVYVCFLQYAPGPNLSRIVRYTVSPEARRAAVPKSCVRLAALP